MRLSALASTFLSNLWLFCSVSPGFDPPLPLLLLTRINTLRPVCQCVCEMCTCGEYMFAHRLAPVQQPLCLPRYLLNVRPPWWDVETSTGEFRRIRIWRKNCNPEFASFFLCAWETGWHWFWGRGSCDFRKCVKDPVHPPHLFDVVFCDNWTKSGNFENLRTRFDVVAGEICDGVQFQGERVQWWSPGFLMHLWDDFWLRSVYSIWGPIYWHWAGVFALIWRYLNMMWLNCSQARLISDSLTPSLIHILTLT